MHLQRSLSEKFPRKKIPKLPPPYLPHLMQAEWLAVALFITRYKLGPYFKSSDVGKVTGNLKIFISINFIICIAF